MRTARIAGPTRWMILAVSCLAVSVGSLAEEGLDLSDWSRVTLLEERPRAWADCLASSNRGVRAEAVRTLVAEGERALPMLGALLHSLEPPVRCRADEILGRVGVIAIPMLTRLTTSPSADVRLHAVSVLGDLAPDSESALDALIARLGDEHAPIVSEAAWALAALREKAAPAVKALSQGLIHPVPLVRIMAAGALASIGPPAKPAAGALARLLRDPIPSARRSAAEALAAIGPDADTAVPALIESLKDETVYVRLCAAGALGSMGENARASIPYLRRAQSDPGLRGEITWALEQITGKQAAEAPVIADAGTPAQGILSSAPVGQWPMQGGSATRNAVSSETGLPGSWDVRLARNIRWSVPVGHDTYCSPVVVGGMVFLGSDNGKPLIKEVVGNCGVLVAFEAASGEVLWQDVTTDTGHGLGEFLLPSTTSTPLVEGDRLYYVTSHCTLRCLDTRGFHDDENDGPIRDEKDVRKWRADVVWEFDIGGALGVFPHEASNCAVLPIGDLLMVCTSNGVNEAHTRLPAPRAPSFIAVEKKTGELAWRHRGPGKNILHGQWSSPAALAVNGRTLALFGGGDGWLYALDATTGRDIWRYDGNPKDAVWRPGSDRPGVVSRNNIVASPVVHHGRVYLTMGQDPWHGSGKGRLHCIDPGGQGDVTDTRVVWINESVGRATCAPIIHDDLVYLADLNGWVHCLDAKTGATVWKHDVQAPIWGAMLLADGRLFVGDEDGAMTIFRIGRTKTIVSKIEMGRALLSTPTAVNGTLYVATSGELYAISGP